jgi:hypothetical protein
MNMYDTGPLFIIQSTPIGNKPETISLIGVGWTPIGSKIRQDPNPYGRDFYYHGDKSLGTDEGSGVPVMPRQNIEHDTFLDNEVGATVRYIKEKFGSSPLLKAYQGALDTLNESDKRWREYQDEEARIQSIFEAGED